MMLRVAPRIALCLGLCLAASIVPLATTVAHAQRAETTQSIIQRGQSEYDDLRFQEALQTFSAALVRAGNTPSDLARIYRYLALTYLALDRREEAEGAYRSLLGLAPDTMPGSDMSPRFREFFTQVRTRWEADGRPGLPPPAPVNIVHRSPPQAEREHEVTLTAVLEDRDHRVATLVLAYRQGTSAVFQRLEMQRDDADTYSATIPASAVSPPLVEYYFEAIDSGGLPVAGRGDVAAPLRIAVPAPGGDITSEPGFWIAIGGGALVLIGGAIALGVVLSNQAPANGTLVFTIED
jgi:tetratricopeptide (TPR) repeat protein